MSDDDKIPTLAELRGKRVKPRRTVAAAPLPGLFDTPASSVEPASHPAESRRAAANPVKPIVSEAPKPEASAEPRVWSVGALVRQIRGLVERSYGSVIVEGEISNWRPAASGHCYFTLKDSQAQLSIVMFRTQAARVRFKPKDGDAVRLRGQLSVYESRGQMQLVAETMEPLGLGALLAAVQALKEKLRREGLFDNKRPLPAFPKCIGVVTSAQGAALRDIVKVCRRRHAAVQLLIYPAAVQGPRCAIEVDAGVRWFSRHPERVDVVIVARGGGSWEDLHGFDDEQVARAIAACSVPVISGIGHATDSTIADAAADVCAPTPSAAAEMVTAAQHRIEERVARLRARLERSGRYEMLRFRQRISHVSADAVMRRVRDSFGQRAQRIDELGFRVEAAANRRMRVLSARLERLDARLQQRDPTRKLATQRRMFESLRLRLEASARMMPAARTGRVERLTARLEALSPVKVLERGYALVYGDDGRLLHSASEVSQGQNITARLAKGRVQATVVAKDDA